MGQALCHLRFPSCSASSPGPHIIETNALLLIIRREGYADDLSALLNMFIYLHAFATDVVAHWGITW